jgi:hypothetical protein
LSNTLGDHSSDPGPTMKSEDCRLTKDH